MSTKHSIYFRKSDLKNSGKSIWTPTIRDWRDVIEDYLEISRNRRNNKFAMFKLQLNLISDLVLINDRIKGYIKLIEDPSERNKIFPNLDIKDSHVEFWEQEIVTYKIIANALKVIGDGIAWRALNYDRPLIYNMCVNSQDPGPLTLSQGFINELHSLEDFVNDPDVVNFVFHGITNFLLIGDITKIYSNGDINFIEVKTQKNKRGSSWKDRVTRQEQRAENVVNIANERQGISSGYESTFRLLPGKPNVFLKFFKSLLISLKNTDTISRVFNNYSGIVLVNYDKLKDSAKVKERIETVEKRLANSEDDVFSRPYSLENIIFSPNRAPFSVHPYSSGDISNFLLGKYVIFFIFNVSSFGRNLEINGWKIKESFINKQDFDKEKDPLFIIEKKGCIVHIPPALVSRAIYEGLVTQDIIRIADDMFAKKTTNPQYYFYGFEGEKYLWD